MIGLIFLVLCALSILAAAPYFTWYVLKRHPWKLGVGQWVSPDSHPISYWTLSLIVLIALWSAVFVLFYGLNYFGRH